jgi:hypothetical protein
LADINLCGHNRIKEVVEEKVIKQKCLAEQLGKSYNKVNGYVKKNKNLGLKYFMR